MSESTTSVDMKEVSWTPVLEKYFAETAEKSDGLAWMHGESELIYNRRRTFIDLPVIVGSGAIAFLNAGSGSLFGSDPTMASIALGIGSLFVGTINTLGSYFAWAKRAEGHRIAALSYAKQSRFLRVEMGLPRDERMRPGDLLKMIKNETDRLAETAPAVPPSIRDKFKARFKTATVAKPEIANGLHPVTVYVSQSTESALAVSVPRSAAGHPALLQPTAATPLSEGPPRTVSASSFPTDEEQTHS